MLTDIAAAFSVAKKKYDKGGNALAETLLAGARCLVALNNHATLRPFGMFAGPPRIEYWVAAAPQNDSIAVSRFIDSSTCVFLVVCHKICPSRYP